MTQQEWEDLFGESDDKNFEGFVVALWFIVVDYNFSITYI